MDLEHAETFGAIQPSMSSSQVSDYTELLQRINTSDLLNLNTTATESAWDESYFTNSCLEVAKLETDKDPILTDAMKPLSIIQSVSLDKFSGANEFNISFVESASPSHGSSNSFYSPSLNKLFVKKQHTFSVNVVYKNTTFEELRLRVMLVCAAPQDLQRPISRCQHDISKDPGATYDPIRDHILRCLNPSTVYVGKAEGVAFHSRLATIVELTGTGQQVVVPVSMQFLCQNSCPTIERRPTALVFTLERQDGTICGRQMLHVKICSCPKRDKDKEEGKQEGGKRKRAIAEPAAATEPPRKLTRQSSSNESGVRMQFAQMSGVRERQRDSPLPSTSLVGRIKKEVDGAVVRSSSNVSSCSSADGDGTAIIMSLKLPDIAVAVDVAEYAFMKVAANMVRCSNEEERGRYARFLTSCRRVKSKYAQFL
uniref:p53 DNA-binding domain-containing protein n=2 Tax=Anopheles triannulatus TaxID=58253 RepID=A0A2M4AH94_9DIPT